MTRRAPHGGAAKLLVRAEELEKDLARAKEALVRVHQMVSSYVPSADNAAQGKGLHALANDLNCEVAELVINCTSELAKARELKAYYAACRRAARSSARAARGGVKVLVTAAASDDAAPLEEALERGEVAP